MLYEVITDRLGLAQAEGDLQLGKVLPIERNHVRVRDREIEQAFPNQLQVIFRPEVIGFGPCEIGVRALEFVQEFCARCPGLNFSYNFV